MVVSVSWLLGLSVVAVALAYFVLYHLRRLRFYVEAAKLPGPPAWPIIGNALIFSGDTESILNNCIKLCETYPSPFRVWLANRLFYAVYDPEELKTIFLSQKTIEKEDLYKFARPWLGTGLFTAPASKWRVHRKLIMPTFNPRILEAFVEVFAIQSEIMVKKMEIELNGKEFDIFNYISLCTLDIICETAMGVPLRAQTEKTSPYIIATKRLFEIIYRRMFNIFLHPDFIFYRTKYGKDEHKCCEYAHSLTNTVIQQKKQAMLNNDNKKKNETSNDKVTRKAFLDLLMELSNDGTKFTDEELREEVDTMIIAGNDTTATANSFTMLMLASYPEVQDKIYKELCDIYGNEVSTATIRHEDLHRMEYLERVIKESLRIFPVGPVLVRKVTDDLNIGKHTLIKGSSVVLAIIKTHRSEEYWKEPFKFDPDRFLPEECAKRHPYCFVPFSAGPRNCLGLKYAMMAMKTLIATVVRNYVIKKDVVLPIRDIKLKADMMLKTVEPITIRIERRIHEAVNCTS